MIPIKIEILFPEYCNLFGEIGNIRYLKLCLPNAEFIETSFLQTPAFADTDVDMIYMGPSTENAQEKIISKLMPYKERLSELMNNGAVMLFIGNALEIFGEYIMDEDKKIPCLSIFDFYAVRHMMNRYGGLVLAKFQDNIDIAGFKAQFTTAHADEDYLKKISFVTVQRGYGFDKKNSFEGIHKNNFFGTYLLGPLLILNPDFTKYLLSLLGIENPALPFEDDVYKAYQLRLAEFQNPKINIS